MVSMLYIKQRLSILNGQLCHDSTGLEDVAMLSNVMSIDVFQRVELFEPFVDCFVPMTHNALHFFSVLSTSERVRALDMSWSLSHATIVHFNSLAFINLQHQCISECLDVIPNAQLACAIHSHNLTCHDANCNLATKAGGIELASVALPSSM